MIRAPWIATALLASLLVMTGSVAADDEVAVPDQGTYGPSAPRSVPSSRSSAIESSAAPAPEITPTVPYPRVFEYPGKTGRLPPQYDEGEGAYTLDSPKVTPRLFTRPSSSPSPAPRGAARPAK